MTSEGFFFLREKVEDFLPYSFVWPFGRRVTISDYKGGKKRRKKEKYNLKTGNWATMK
jgi:hypothetical protein